MSNKLLNLNLLKKLKKPFLIYYKTQKKDKSLTKHGFRFIDQLITFKGKIKKSPTNELLSFRLARRLDLKQVQLISSRNMRLDRFYFDEEINNQIAKKIKLRWLINYFKKKRGTHLFVCLKKQVITGFCLVILNSKKNLVIIDLICVDKKFQSRGIGHQMFSFIRQYFNNDNLIFIVGSYRKNIKAIRFYKKIGLKLYKTENIYHYHKK